MSSFDGKVAVVTGAGSGIGRALAIGLARRGALTAISDVNEEGLRSTAARVSAVGRQPHVAVLDVSDRCAVRDYATAVAEHHGAVNQLYNNAGVAGGAAPLLEGDYETYERIVNINLWGVINGTKEFLPHLIASGDGHVVNISSLNGLLAQASMSAYCTTKFAVRGFTESLRAEMLAEGHPVRVTVVHPGGIATNIATSALAEAERAGREITDQQRHRAEAYNAKLLKMSPVRAAETILAGVAANRSRILVGRDAKGVDLLVRVLPRAHARMVLWWEKRTFG
ncbi:MULTISPECIES: SDR family NAD(P)-dependent oxidoreductase [unclassified Mycobacterium]|uniref:SDR family NAD(P)-dependent oxidoreductase n=1 Tax=unclassified Mycobacterium TaxID=2642494 RepID=UPI0007404872|nr:MULTISPECIES: SDR family NAD(P)-dependent oxidoreductase [unclassified Mycobacterium]KUH85469.1 acetoin dehydrogenase [Mycobacterium sp. GA-1999]KUH91328.1 acetoin dehydrogenase [Mycobacterium sp. GA-0227b]KUH96416.1 acetoin dehydrogenase [Mycobacterium sp. IS-1556]